MPVLIKPWVCFGCHVICGVPCSGIMGLRENSKSSIPTLCDWSWTHVQLIGWELLALAKMASKMCHAGWALTHHHLRTPVGAVFSFQGGGSCPQARPVQDGSSRSTPAGARSQSGLPSWPAGKCLLPLIPTIKTIFWKKHKLVSRGDCLYLLLCLESSQ